MRNTDDMRVFGDPGNWPDQDLIGYSHAFDAELTLRAYTEGVFPMPLEAPVLDDGAMGWWSPTDRGVLLPESLRVTRSLRKMTQRYRCTVDAAFDDVIARCGDPSRPGGWIDARIRDVYAELYQRGIVHSVEAWDHDGRLVGGLYGVSLGGLFAGESMFHDPEHGRDASKVALVHLVRCLSADGVARLVDVQWLTDHLATLGAVEIPRAEYLEAAKESLTLPAPDWRALSGNSAMNPSRHPSASRVVTPDE